MLELEQSTYEAYEIYIKKHLIPAFGEKELEELRPLDVQEYVSDKLVNGRCDGNGGLSRVSVAKHLQVLREALDRAVILELIPKNPAERIKPPRVRVAPEVSVMLEATAAARMLKTFREAEHPLYPLVLVTLYYGLRRSEVLGLCWSAIDFEKSTIRIERSVVKNVSIVAKDRMKTQSSYRAYELIPEVAEALKELKECQRRNRSERLRNGYTYEESDYCFVWDDGKLFRPDYVTRSFQRHLARNGFRKMRFHDLRHSTASILFDRGWNIRDVQAWLGHSDLRTTMDIYVHYRRERLKLVGKDLTGLFVESKQGSE